MMVGEGFWSSFLYVLFAPWSMIQKKRCQHDWHPKVLGGRSPGIKLHPLILGTKTSSCLVRQEHSTDQLVTKKSTARRYVVRYTIEQEHFLYLGAPLGCSLVVAREGATPEDDRPPMFFSWLEV